VKGLYCSRFVKQDCSHRQRNHHRHGKSCLVLDCLHFVPKGLQQTRLPKESMKWGEISRLFVFAFAGTYALRSHCESSMMSWSKDFIGVRERCECAKRFFKILRCLLSDAYVYCSTNIYCIIRPVKSDTNRAKRSHIFLVAKRTRTPPPSIQK
jgi:hypothetical protein